MSDNPLQIKFKNRQNPKAEFDCIRLEKLYKRENLNHSPFEHHLVDFYILIIVEEGLGHHTIDFTTYPIEAGSVVTIRKDQIHKFHENENIKGTMLLFTEDFLASYLEKLEALKSLQLFNEVLGSPKITIPKKNIKQFSQLISRIRTEYFVTNDDYSLGILRSELHILIAHLFRLKSLKSNIHDKRKYLNDFIELQQLIEKNAYQFNKVKDYARIMGVSSKTLNNITHEIVHKSAKEFIDEICLKQIKRLLINTNHSIKEIAYDTGFDEPTNFYKYFKRQTGLTPESFRSNYI